MADLMVFEHQELYCWVNPMMAVDWLVVDRSSLELMVELVVVAVTEYRTWTLPADHRSPSSWGGKYRKRTARWRGVLFLLTLNPLPRMEAPSWQPMNANEQSVEEAEADPAAPQLNFPPNAQTHRPRRVAH